MKKLIFLCVLVGCIPNYSSGTRSGQVIKFSRKGIFVKTWEGTMALGGFSKNDQGVAIANLWDFTVCNEELVPEITHAQESGKRIQLHYTQEYIVAPWRRETEYCIDKVEEPTT